MWRLLTLDRMPEPEAMSDETEAAVYRRQAAEPYLTRSDDRLIARVLRYGPQKLVVDIGTGPGQIPVSLAQRCSSLSIIGIDVSEAMLSLARKHAAAARVIERVRFVRGDATRLPLPARAADIVICNSTLHHFADPVSVFNEAHRVLRPGGRVLIRDLRRPSRLSSAAHIAFFGRHYRGRMRELFGISVRAAYTKSELRHLMARSRLAGATVHREGMVHLVAVGQTRESAAKDVHAPH